MTRIEKLRSASDDEIVGSILWLTENSGVYCKMRIDCEGDLLEGDEIPLDRCKECLTEWLRKPAEGGADG